MKLRLVIPCARLVAGYADALENGMNGPAGSRASAEKIAEMRDDPQGFIDGFNGPQPPTVTLPDGRIVPRAPSRDLWAEDDAGLFIGRVSIREKLNDDLRRFGGHIGYGVAMRWRRQGAATEMLRLAIIHCRKHLWIKEDLILTCDDDNIASARVIEKNGGVLVDVTPHPYRPEAALRRYRIPA